MKLNDLIAAMSAATCQKCGRRFFATNTAGYRQRARLDVPDSELCHCGRGEKDDERRAA